MDRKKTAVLSADRETLGFLNGFFSARRRFRASYFDGCAEFLAYAEGEEPSCLIADASFLPELRRSGNSVPVVAVLGSDVGSGIKAAVKAGAADYIYRPFMAEDLAFKIDSVSAERERLVEMECGLRELEAVVSLTNLISGTLEPREVLYRIVRKIAETMPVTRCSMIKVDLNRKSAVVVASFENPSFPDISIRLNKYPEIRAALSSKRPVVVSDVGRDPIMKDVREILAPLGIKSILVLPVIFRDKVIGTLFLRTSRKEHAFTDTEVRLLKTLADVSANALNNAFQFERMEDERARLEKLAITDYLTGIYNIRYFYHRLAEEFSRCQRYGLPISCLMFDIDYFKKINDQYGHRTGDAVLREFSQLLKKHTRKSDVLARYGGEEFVLLLPQTGFHGAAAEAERLREFTRDHTFKGLREGARLTISAGIAVYPDHKMKTHDELITCADQALFTAKNSGRDRAVVYSK